MNWQQFQSVSPKTLASTGDIYNIPSKRSDVSLAMDHMHMSIGMCSELRELSVAIRKRDGPNIVEELCDILWYAAGEIYLWRQHEASELHLSSNFRFDEAEYMRHEDHLVTFTDAISGYANFTKKRAVYKKPYEAETFDSTLFIIIRGIYHYAYHEFEDDSIEQGLDKNIFKLQGVRYKDGVFTTDQAINRDKDEERKAIE